MRVLAIDTALAACSAAVLDTDYGGIIASESLPMARGHAEALMPLLARVMQDAGMAFRDIDRIAVTTGPGSFTGLRVGIAAARGIALAAGKPAVGPVDARRPTRRRIWPPTKPCRWSPPSTRGTRMSICRFSAPAAARSPRRGSPACRSGAGGGGGARPASSARRRKPSPPRCRQIDAEPAVVDARAAPDIAWVARMGAVVPEGTVAAEAAISARARRAAAKRRPTAAPMMNFVTRLFEPVRAGVSEARERDAAAIAAAARGVVSARLGRGRVSPAVCIDRAVVAHRAMIGRTTDRIHPVAARRRRS